MSEIEKIRESIDDIDDKIVELLNKRANLALEVKNTKTGQSATRVDRQNSIIRRIISKNKGPLSDIALAEIYTQLVSTFRDRLQLESPMKVSFLGPKGTYSEEAVVKIFGKSVDFNPEDMIEAVFRSTEAGTTAVAVVPIENSSEGAVHETHRQLLKTNLNIISEVTIPVIHCLLSNDTKPQNIKKVFAHPQSLGQCRTWLATHLPDAELIPCSSNASAAENASKTKKSAAIASKSASDIYNLNILENGINDQPDNKTRFLALGDMETKSTGNDKTSILCMLKDRAGALHEVLGVFAEENLSMTRLESQPYQNDQYAFYIDFLGHKDDAAVAKSLEKISNLSKICKILGSYPKGIN